MWGANVLKTDLCGGGQCSKASADLSVFALVVSVALHRVGEEPVLLRTAVCVVLDPVL
jgi:hypothetical protein